MASIIRFPRKGGLPRMYSPAEIAEATGISYDAALGLCKMHGIQLGKRYYISYSNAMRVLEGTQAHGGP